MSGLKPRLVQASPGLAPGLPRPAFKPSCHQMPKQWKGGWAQRFGLGATCKRFLKKTPATVQKNHRGRPSAKIRDHASALAAELRGDFLKNQASCKKIQRLAEAAEVSGASGVSPLASCSQEGYSASNLARDMQRRLFDRDAIPLYWVEMPDGVSMPMALPHEVLAGFGARVPTPGTKAREVLEEVCQALHVEASTTTAVALWGDSVPFSKRRSIFVLCMSFPSEPAGPRLPIMVLPGKANTAAYREPLMEVVLWSMRCALRGRYPHARHDGNAFGPADSRRAALARQPLARAVLTQIKGDWEYLHNYLGLPAHNTLQICWRCTAGLHTWRHLDEHRPMTSEAFFSSAREQGLYLSPLFSCPGVTTATVCQDWLHCCDLGVGQVIVGCVFWEALVHLMPGSNRTERVKALWSEIQAWYKVCPPPSKLDGLTEKMIRVSRDAGPYLHSKAAECRGLQGFLVPLSARLHDHCQTAHSLLVMDLCSAFWALVRASTVEEALDLPRAKALVLEVHRLLVTLEEEEIQANAYYSTWRLRPKLHQLMELVTNTMPRHGGANLYWCYIDESYGGIVAKRALQRGRPVNVSAQAEKVLLRIYSLREFS